MPSLFLYPNLGGIFMWNILIHFLTFTGGIRVMGKDELHIEFNYQDEYQKAVSLAEQIAAHNEERKVG